MRFCYLITVILIFLLPVFGRPVRAETVRVTISADEIYYDYHTKQIEANGNVRISYKETRVECDHAIIDHEENILLATGNVYLVKENDEFNGDRFLYYLETQRGWIYPVVTEVIDDQIAEPLIFTAAEAFLKSEEVLFKKSYLTGCDLEKPHYHFTAKKIEYLPGDRIKMHHVWYWEHRVPLFYLPVLFISLEEDSNNFGAQVGWNNSEGWWLLWWYTYYFSDNNSNSLMVRNKTTEHGVDRWELQHINKLTPTRTFTETFEFLDNDKIGNYNDDYRLGLKYEDRTNPKMNYEAWLNAWNRYTYKGDNYYESELVLNLKGQSPYPNIKFYHDIKEELGLPETYLDQSWEYYFDPTFNIFLKGQWLDSERRGYDEPRMDYYFDLFKRWDNSDLAFKLSERNISLNESIFPDITYTIHQLNAPLVGKIKTTTQYTHKETLNTYTGVATEGDRAALDIMKTNSLWAKGRLSLTNEIQLRCRSYVINDIPSEVGALTESLNLTNNFTDKLSTTVKMGFTEVQGLTNTFFTGNDDIRPGADIWNYWYWNGKIFRANFNTGYNFETEYAYPANFGASLFYNSTSVNFGTIYYWDNGPRYDTGFGTTSLSINSTPRKDWRLSLALNYNFISQLWSAKRLDLELTEQLNPNWKVNLRMNYNMLIDDFSNANAGLTYNWHCRDVEFHYDWIERQYWLQLTFKAFPQARFNTAENPMELLNYE
ncbi:MAG: LPS-assembly protein LptD [Firmicutes bacterium]|nr:LPS-assembly protein LptD [Bacillota bacterium]